MEQIAKQHKYESSNYNIVRIYNGVDTVVIFIINIKEIQPNYIYNVTLTYI